MTPEPSKEDLKRYDDINYYEIDGVKHIEKTLGNHEWVLLEDHVKALAKLRAEGERKYQSVKDEYVCELNKTQNEWEAEKSALEEQVRQLEAHKPDYSDPRYETLNDRIRENRELSEINKRQKEEIARLKSRNEELEAELQATRKACDQAHQNTLDRDEEIDRLKAENEQYWALAKQHQEALKSSQKALGEMKLYHHNAKEEVHRLTASLAAAQEKLRESSGLIKMLDRDRKYPSLDEHLDKVKEILSDKDGQAAFEKWKRIEAVKDIAIKAIHDEEELSWDMPDDFWKALNNDRKTIQQALRDTVRLTKRNIIQRFLEALDGQGGGV